MRYEPGLIAAKDLESLKLYLQDELRRIAFALYEVDGILLPQLNVAPTKPRDGMIVLADGTNWNPGSGAGFYGRYGGAWVKLG